MAPRRFGIFGKRAQDGASDTKRPIAGENLPPGADVPTEAEAVTAARRRAARAMAAREQELERALAAAESGLAAERRAREKAEQRAQDTERRARELATELRRERDGRRRRRRAGRRRHERRTSLGRIARRDPSGGCPPNRGPAGGSSVGDGGPAARPSDIPKPTSSVDVQSAAERDDCASVRGWIAGALHGPVNLNRAGFAELRALGMSVTQAKRVLREREARGGFEAVSELDDLPGFPQIFLAGLKSRLTV